MTLRGRILVIAVVLGGIVLASAARAIDRQLLFTQDDLLPSSEAANVVFFNTTPIGEPALYSTAGGILRQRTFDTTGNASYLYPNASVTGGGLASTRAVSMQARLRVRRIGEGAPVTSGGAYLQVFDGAYRRAVLFRVGGFEVPQAAGAPAFVSIDISAYHDYRIESSGNSAQVRIYVDGTLVHTGTAPSSALNGFDFGDGSSDPGAGADVDWDYVRVLQLTGYQNIRLTSDGGASRRPRVALDPNNNLVVVWQDDRFGNNEILWQKFDPLGNPLTATIRVTNTAASSVRPDVACDAAGTSHVVWQEGEDVNGVGTVYLCRLNAQGAKILLNDVLVKDFSGDARVTCPSSGVSDLAWSRYMATDQDVYYRRYNAAGTQSCERRFNAGTIPALAKTPAICSASSGDAQLFWIDMNTSFQVHLRQGAATNACGSGAAVAYNNASSLRPSTDPGGPFIYTVFEVGGNIYNFQGAPNACKISQASGTSTRPSVGADATQGYAAWQDTRDGNSEIYMCRFNGCTNNSGDLRLTSNSASSETPDLALEESGSGRWSVVWSDNRDGNDEIYLASAVSTETPMSLRLRVEAKAEHDNDPVIAPNVPLEGVQVTLHEGFNSWPGVTDVNGIVVFPPAAYSPGATYTLKLDGPDYRIYLEADGAPAAIPEVTIPAQYGETNYTWVYSRPIQAAYQIQRFRRDYWRDRLDYVWTTPRRLHPELTENELEIHVFERPEKAIHDAGGGKPGSTTLACMTNKCEESDTIDHEHGHNVVMDRFAASGSTVRIVGVGPNTNEGYAIDEGLADYFAASFTHDPKIDRCNGCMTDMDPICLCLHPLRDISKHKQYPTGSPYRFEGHEGSKILSSALWDLRNRLDGNNASEAPITDRLALAALDRMVAGWQPEQTFKIADYYDAVKAEDASLGGSHAQAIDDAFEASNVGPGAISYTPLQWLDDEGITTLDATAADRVRIAWSPVPGASSYNVLASSTSYNFYSGLGQSFVEVATGVTDTSFVYLDRDARSEYLFSVVAVDTGEGAGYPAIPAYVPALDLVGVVPGASPGSNRWLFAAPNPSRAEVGIYFHLASPQEVSVRILDSSGRLVKSWPATRYASGRQRVDWDGDNGNGSRVGAGVYFVEIRGASWRVTGKSLLLR